MVEVAGIDVAKLPQKNIHLLRRKVGMAYQDFKLLPERTVAENIAISMEVVYRSGSFIEKRTRELRKAPTDNIDTHMGTLDDGIGQ